MKNSPYETFACSGYELERITKDLEREFLGNKVSSSLGMSCAARDFTGYVLFSNLDFNPKSFAHPIDIKLDARSPTGNNMISVIDIRPFTKVSRTTNYDTTKHIEKNLAEIRLNLHLIWQSSDKYLIQNSCDPLIQLYSSWISESISKHLNVDGLTQLTIATVAAWWFWCQYNSKEDVSDTTRPKIYRKIAEATRSSFDSVESDLDGIEYFDDIESFCKEVTERTDSSRIKHLDPATIIQLSSGGWIGTWAREIMSVCIEYPPYLAAVVYVAMHERGVRSSLFAKFVQRFSSRPEIKGFKETLEIISRESRDNQ